MLRELRINDFALIGDLALEFGPGLNVVSGETGAGKSVLVEALGLLLGDRAANEMIREGCEHAQVQGVLENIPADLVEAAGAEPDSEVVIRRRISASSANRIYFNGNLINVKTLKDFGMRVADIHGQFEHQSLLDEGTQLELLDTAGGLGSLLTECEAAFSQLSRARRELERLQGLDRSRAEREEFLKFQVREIEETDLRPGEDEQLETDRVRVANTEKLATLARQAHGLLREDERGVLDQVNGIVHNLEMMESSDPGVSGQLESVRGLLPALEEVTAFLSRYLEALEEEPRSIDEIISRLERISRLRKKYGSTVEQVLAHLQTCRAELGELEDLEHELSRAGERVSESRVVYKGVCDRLREARRATAARLARDATAELHQLDMKDARFEILLEEAPEGPSGHDAIRFLFSANQGQSVRPLNRVASGGEMSRVMLGIKTVMGSGTPVLVFDEIDAGIGGATAGALGQRLSRIGREHQVICVTHLAQIACYADRHVAIEKKKSADRVAITARVLEEEDRVHEMARMLSGTHTEASRRHARELLASATADKIAQGAGRKRRRAS